MAKFETSKQELDDKDIDDYVKANPNTQNRGINEANMKNETRTILEQVKQAPWYSGQLCREEAKKMLSDRPAGTFIIRYSYKPPIVGKDGYLIARDRAVISVKCNKIEHIIINGKLNPDDTLVVYLTDVDNLKFDDVNSALVHFSQNSLKVLNSDRFKEEDVIKYYVENKEHKTLPFTDKDIMGRDTNIPSVVRSPKTSGIRCQVNHSGGVLQIDKSDVQLIVPKGAIDGDHVYEIEGKIHVTNLDEFRKFVTNWHVDEHFISPVAEFNIISANRKDIDIKDVTFRDFIQIKIPHCIDQQDELSHIKVYALNPDREQYGRNIPRAPSAELSSLTSNKMQSMQDSYFTADAEYVTVYTRHFTQYFCTHQKPWDLHMEFLLFGSFQQYEFQEVHLKVYLCEALFRLREFKEVIKEDERGLNRELLEQQSIELPPGRMDSTSEFHVQIHPDVDVSKRDRSNWQPIVSQGFDQSGLKKLRASDVLECYHICQGGIPPPKPKDIKLAMRNYGTPTSSFSGHLNIAVANGVLVPPLQTISNNSCSFTMMRRDLSREQLHHHHAMNVNVGSQSPLSRSPGSSSLE